MRNVYFYRHNREGQVERVAIRPRGSLALAEDEMVKKGWTRKKLRPRSRAEVVSGFLERLLA